MKQNSGDANLTIAELKDAINRRECTQLLNRMSAYSSNITGSDSYWNKRRSELEATFEQKEAATVFFTFSYADNYWQDLHRLMPRNYNQDINSIESTNPIKYKDVINNPHLVDWYFGERLNSFLEIVFDGILDCEWRCHRSF